jgi:hypothetical protein
MRHFLTASVLLALALPGQTQPTTAAKPAAKPATPSARAFLPPDYRMVVHADLVMLREREIWDELEVSLLKVAFQSMEKELGFELDKLDRVTMCAVAPDGAVENAGQPKQVVVFEGNAPLAIPARVRRDPTTVVGEYEVRVRAHGREAWFVQPRPELVVEGDERFVRPALEGKTSDASPCPDVMSLLSGRRDLLAYYVVDIGHPSMAQRRNEIFAGVTWPADEAPTFLCMRVVATGTADDPRLAVEAVLRHPKEGEGIASSEQGVGRLLERLRKLPQMRAALPVLKNVETSRDRTDLVLRIDLGRARDAVGHLAALLAPMLMPAEARSADVPATPVDPAPPPAPQPPKKK